MFEHDGMDDDPRDTDGGDSTTVPRGALAEATGFVQVPPQVPVAPEPAPPANALDLIGFRHALSHMAPAATHDPATRGSRAIASPDGVEAEAIDRIRALEDLKAACAAAQVRETAALHTHRTQAEAARGMPADRRGRGLSGEIALARRESTSRGSNHLRMARNLATDLPHTLAALTSGGISEEQAAAVDRQTHWLDPNHRRAADVALADRLGFLSNREITREAQEAAQSLDPAAAVEHQEQARRDRHLSLKVAETNPGMAYLTALLPIAQAVACYQNLTDHAASTVASGNAGDRTPQQVLTDTLIERLTGQNTAETVPVEIQLVMTDTSLFGRTGPGNGTPGTEGSSPDTARDAARTTDTSDTGDIGDAPAWLPGHGPLPAAMARRLVANTEAAVFIRRLYTAPDTGQLVAMDSQRRTFTGLLRQMILIRDGTCRTPYCDAPIRHVDHATPHRDGGATSYANGSGLCVRCNHTKEHPGWTHQATADELHVTTPTGHRYTSQPRPLVPPPDPAQPAEAAVAMEEPSPRHRDVACTTETVTTAKLAAPCRIDYPAARERPGEQVEYDRAA